MIQNNLSTIMDSQNLKVKDLAQQTGLSPNGLYNLYFGRHNGVKYETLDRLCKFFQCDVGEILQYVPDNQ